jgi:hypothetical protein
MVACGHDRAPRARGGTSRSMTGEVPITWGRVRHKRSVSRIRGAAGGRATPSPRETMRGGRAGHGTISRRARSSSATANSIGRLQGSRYSSRRQLRAHQEADVAEPGLGPGLSGYCQRTRPSDTRTKKIFRRPWNTHEPTMNSGKVGNGRTYPPAGSPAVLRWAIDGATLILSKVTDARALMRVNRGHANPRSSDGRARPAEGKLAREPGRRLT